MNLDSALVCNDDADDGEAFFVFFNILGAFVPWAAMVPISFFFILDDLGAFGRFGCNDSNVEPKRFLRIFLRFYEIILNA